MKTIKHILAVAVILISAVACKNNPEPEVKTVDTKTSNETTKKLDPNATYAKAEFKIEGMTCAMGCAKTIEKKMAKMDGVKSAKVDFERELAMVEYDEAVVTPNSLEEAVAKAGDTYKVKDMHTVDTFTEKVAEEKE
ncbi:heavy-metal-associated domain-containing protein [Sediminibacter sp. Hel_I_10]|uniref:heavy-metal-associated domain-containing protein n=1 Tax=Sediminibacter sp. Hel_I_10 TaxID=1392490 RepID=UPI000567B003|nr:heavy metal-associated domain-containing protein [Sediminibacter sp. Hel_I_10]